MEWRTKEEVESEGYEVGPSALKSMRRRMEKVREMRVKAW